MANNNKHNILYVDDEAENLDGFKFTFRKDYNIYTAESAEEGLKVLENEAIEVILSDQKMPEKSGVDFFEEVVEKYPDTIRLIVTGYINIESVIDAVNKGKIYHYITKPWRKEELQIILDNAIEKYELLKKNKILINDLIETNKNLTLAKQKAEESDKLKSAFLSNISHEIRTPLNAIIGFSNLLIANYFEKEKANEYFSLIENNSSQLLFIIENILDISKIETGQIRLGYTSFNVRELLNDIPNEILKQGDIHEVKEVSFSFDIADGLNGELFTGDLIRIKQVLAAIVDNAYKFSETGTIIIGARIVENLKEFDHLIDYTTILKRGSFISPDNLELEPKIRLIEFFINDTGIGFDQSECFNVFRRFVKLDQGRDKLYRGNGIGLSLVKSLISLMKGNLFVKSQKGVGSSFIFHLPFQNNKQVF